MAMHDKKLTGSQAHTGVRGSSASSTLAVASKKEIVKVCAWCPQVGRHRKYENGKWIDDEKQGDYPAGTVSHGICPDCYAREFGEEE